MGTDNVVDHPKKNRGNQKAGIKAMSLLPAQSIEDTDRLDEEMLALEYGHKILIMRKSAGFTQTALAEKIGKDQATIARLERGNGGHILNLKTLHLVAKACKCSINLTPEKVDGHRDGEYNAEVFSMRNINKKFGNQKK